MERIMSVGSVESVWQLLSTPKATAVYLVVLMVLVAVLTACILAALHRVRKIESDPANYQKGNGKDTSPGSRFSNLTRIDREEETLGVGQYASKQLPEICEEFRNYAASEQGLYYDIADIRRFIAGMGVSRLLILRGMSGTGKTSLAYAAGEYFGNPSTIVPVQPMWKERSDILGYFNEFTGRFNETTLLCKLYEAGGRGDVYITVLDEVNISRIEYYFAEFLSLLEIPDPKKRELEVVPDSWDSDPKRLHGGKMLLPENMWFVGTANNDDSTFAISDKVYDRAMVIDLDKKGEFFAATPVSGTHISYEDLVGQFSQAKQRYALSEEGRQRLEKLDAYLSRVFRIGFGNRIQRQIENYVPIMVACGGKEEGALDDILARKILRKLEQQSQALLRQEIPSLLSFLGETFGQDELPQCRAYLVRLQKNC